MKRKLLCAAILMVAVLSGCNAPENVCGTIAGYTQLNRYSYMYLNTGEKFYTPEPAYWQQFMPIGTYHCFLYSAMGDIRKVTK